MNVPSLESIFGLLSIQSQKLKETKTAIWLGREVMQLFDKFSSLCTIAKVSVVAISLVTYGIADLMSRKRDESATGETTNLEEFDKKNENRELLTSRFSDSVLPEEMTQKIFEFLTQKELAEISIVSKYFNKASEKAIICRLQNQNLSELTLPGFTDKQLVGLLEKNRVSLNSLNLKSRNLKNLNLMKAIGSLKKLKSLKLSECKIGDISFLAGLENLKFLSLNGSILLKKDQALEIIGSLEQLESLNLSFCKITDISSLEGRLKNLKVLDLGGNHGLGDGALKIIRSFEQLESLDLRSCCNIKDISLLKDRLKNLKGLNLGSKRKLEDETLKTIGSFEQLKSLNLRFCNIKDISFLAGLKNLKVLV